MRSFQIFLIAIASVLSLAANDASESLPDGLYAIFDVHTDAGPAGEIICRLHFDLTPQTVANFVGLATGEQHWLDPELPLLRSAPYFDGLTFHRIIKDFVIQGGCPLGNGQGGPGYAFRDEIVDSLRHDRAGILSMANSGIHSNGSQFFLTLAPTPHLDGVHTVFGEVVHGMDLLMQLGDVPTSNDRPIDPVTIQSVRILRRGEAADQFAVTEQGLPRITFHQISISTLDGAIHLGYSTPANSLVTWHLSDDLQTWASSRPSIFNAPFNGDLALDSMVNVSDYNTIFIKQHQVQYTETLLSPNNLADKQLELVYDDINVSIILGFTAVNSGDFHAIDDEGQSDPGNFNSNFTPGPFHSLLNLQFLTQFYPQSLQLVFTSTTEGSFRGVFINDFSQSIPLSGRFTLTELPPDP